MYLQENKAEYKVFLQDLKGMRMQLMVEDTGAVDHVLLEDWLNSVSMFVITDRGKGLIPAVAEELPRATHAACMHHLQDNLLSNAQTKVYDRKMLWKIQGCCTEASFEAQMAVLARDAPRTEEYLRGLPTESWALWKFEVDGVVTHGQVKPYVSTVAGLWIGGVACACMRNIVSWCWVGGDRF